MAPQPKRKLTRSRSGKRHGGQKKLGLPTLVKCSSCGNLKVPHRICPHCGSK